MTDSVTPGRGQQAVRPGAALGPSTSADVHAEVAGDAGEPVAVALADGADLRRPETIFTGYVITAWLGHVQFDA